MKTAFSVLLVIVGAVLALRERSAARSVGLIPAGLRGIAVARIRRRIRIAVLFIFLGLVTASGHATQPEVNPIRFVIIWSTATLFSIALLGYGVAEARSLRRTQR